jgi:hypothetical protein
MSNSRAKGLTQTAMQVAMSRPRSARNRTEGQPVCKQHSQHATPICNLFFIIFIVLTETNVRNVTPCRLLDRYIHIKPHVLTSHKKATFPLLVQFGYSMKYTLFWRNTSNCEGYTMCRDNIKMDHARFLETANGLNWRRPASSGAIVNTVKELQVP